MPIIDLASFEFITFLRTEEIILRKAVTYDLATNPN